MKMINAAYIGPQKQKRTELPDRGAVLEMIERRQWLRHWVGWRVTLIAANQIGIECHLVEDKICYVVLMAIECLRLSALLPLDARLAHL